MSERPPDDDATRHLPRPSVPRDGTLPRLSLPAIPDTVLPRPAHPSLPRERTPHPRSLVPRNPTAQRMPPLSPGTTIIPPPHKPPARRPGLVPLSGHARSRAARLSAVVGVVLALVVLISFTPLAALARPLVPWVVNSNLAIYPTPTPSHPVAAGEPAFVCAALPFARLAQQELVAGRRPQPHPWYVSVILAQWGIEQGWTIPGYTGYNWGNSSALDGYPSVPGTNQPGSPSRFAYATSAEMGVAIYVAFAQNGLYDAVAAAWPQGPQAQALALGASPWDAAHYTGTGHPGSSLLDVMAYYHLTRLDQPGATCTNG